MAQQMYLVITLRRPVDDQAQGTQIYELIKERLTDRPDVDVTGHVTNHFDLGEPPS